jgi:hypothetical protein
MREIRRKECVTVTLRETESETTFLFERILYGVHVVCP